MQNRPPKKRLTRLAPAPERKNPHGKGYTTFVRVMRLALPLVAIGIIGLLLSWPRVEETMAPVPREAVAPEAIGKNELVNPRFESTDTQNRPFAITAIRAVQSPRDPSVVLLDDPKGDMRIDDRQTVMATAERGAYRQDTERLLLQGKVTLSHNEGYVMTTEKLLLNLKTREAWSDQPVSGHGPAGTLEASGLHADANAERLVFTGPVRLVLNRSIGGLP